MVAANELSLARNINIKRNPEYCKEKTLRQRHHK